MRLYIGLEAIGEADDKGMRTVMTTLNGQLRPVFVRDRSIVVEAKAAEKADSAKPGQVAAPFSGVVTLQVARRRHGRRRTVRRVDRGHEDGGGHHRPHRRARSSGSPSRRPSRSTPGDLLVVVAPA